ncbi:hypothetical protein FKM82_020741, partial [Ascaphus truei]
SEEEFLRDLGMDGKDIDVEEDEEEEEEEASEEEELEEAKTEDSIKESAGRKTDSFVDKNIQRLMHSLQQEGMSSPLLWLQNCLNRTAEDREEDGKG